MPRQDSIVRLRRRHLALLAPEEGLFARAYREQMEKLRDASRDTVNPFDLKKWSDRVARALLPVYDGIMQRAGKVYIQDLFRAGRKSAQQEIEKAGGKGGVRAGVISIQEDFMERLRGTIETTYEALADVARQASEDNLDEEEIADLINDEWDDVLGRRSDMTAATEANGAVNSINDYLAQVMVEEQHWVTAKDERVRPTHVIYEEAGAKPVGYNWADLSDGNYTLRYPCDPQCDEAGEVVNCRCFVAPAGIVELAPDELAAYLDEFDLDESDLLLSEEQTS